MTQEEIREDVENIMPALGVIHTRLNDLVNQIREEGLAGTAAISVLKFDGLELVNKNIREGWEGLEYFLEPEG